MLSPTPPLSSRILPCWFSYGEMHKHNHRQSANIKRHPQTLCGCQEAEQSIDSACKQHPAQKKRKPCHSFAILLVSLFKRCHAGIFSRHRTFASFYTMHTERHSVKMLFFCVDWSVFLDLSYLACEICISSDFFSCLIILFTCIAFLREFAIDSFEMN